MTSKGYVEDGIAGFIEAVSKEGEFNSPPGHVWVKLHGLNENFLLPIAATLSVRVGVYGKGIVRNTKSGQLLCDFEACDPPEGLKPAGAGFVPTGPVPESSNLLSPTPAATKPTQESGELIRAEARPGELRKRSEGQLTFLPLDLIVVSAWNPNEMDPQTYEDLVQDMQDGGVYSVNPIDVFPISADDQGQVHYQIADGHNRFNAALDSKWPKIRAQIFPDMDESAAKVWNYRKNRERGTLNPTKEGMLFFADWKKGNGSLTEEEIASKYGVDVSTVSRRMSILPTAKTGVSSTHAEEIVAKIKNPEVQTIVARAVTKQKLTPDETREVAEKVRDELRTIPNAPKKFLKERADRFAREIRRSREGLPKEGVEVETVHCPECDASFRVMHLGMNRHRVVRVKQ